MQCQLCHEECVAIRNLAAHIRHNHPDWSKKDYYDTFIHVRTSVCKCGRQKIFRGLGEGYRDVCSVSCRTAHHSNSGKKQTNEHIRRRIAATDQRAKEEKRIRSLSERYGVTNPSQLPDFNAKRIQTSLQRYGTTHPQRASITRPSGKWKTVVISQREFRVQGYEDLFLEHAHEYGVDTMSLVHGKGNCPKFHWEDISGTSHVYFPDFYDSASHTVIEIKSMWTYSLSKDIVELKLQSVRNAGYNVLCVIYRNRCDNNPELIR